MEKLEEIDIIENYIIYKKHREHLDYRLLLKRYFGN
jgi:hypothetical protein